MTSYKWLETIYYRMSEYAGFWDTELERVVQKLQHGGIAKTMNHNGNEVVVRVKKLDNGRFGSNEFCY